MVIDSHMHLTRKVNFDVETNTRMGLGIQIGRASCRERV